MPPLARATRLLGPAAVLILSTSLGPGIAPGIASAQCCPIYHDGAQHSTAQQTLTQFEVMLDHLAEQLDQLTEMQLAIGLPGPLPGLPGLDGFVDLFPGLDGWAAALQAPLDGLDLSGLDLSGLDLSGLDLSGLVEFEGPEELASLLGELQAQGALVIAEISAVAEHLHGQALGQSQTLIGLGRMLEEIGLTDQQQQATASIQGALDVSRQMLAYADGLGAAAAAQLNAQRAQEARNAMVAAHASGLHALSAGARSSDRIAALNAASLSAATEREQLAVLGIIMLSQLEEAASERALLATGLRLQAADALSTLDPMQRLGLTPPPSSGAGP